MAESKISICNLALSRFGGGKITSLTDGSEEARVLDLIYNSCLESTLRAFPWNFANAEKILALSTTTFAGWDYVYEYPVNCADILRVYAEGDARVYKRQTFKVRTSGIEKFICCDIEDAYAEYTYMVTDPTMFDPGFVKAFSYYLAAESVSMSGNAQKSAEMMQKFQLAINEAQHINAVEGNVQPEWPTSYVTGRS